MATDVKPVQNQKVFVMLESVLELQKEIERLASAASTTPSGNLNLYYARGLYSAAKQLGIPLKLSTQTQDKMAR